MYAHLVLIAQSHLLSMLIVPEYIFCLLFAGLNVGCFYAISTLLNRMIIEHYPVSPHVSAACCHVLFASCFVLC